MFSREMIVKIFLFLYIVWMNCIPSHSFSSSSLHRYPGRTYSSEITSRLYVVTTGPLHTPEEQRTSLRENFPDQDHLATAILPEITPLEYYRLSQGEIIKKQNRKGHSGTGLVVLEVPADSQSVFNTLSSFERYEELIPTVRRAIIQRKSEYVVKAQYSLSRFHLQANIVQTVLPEQRIIRFNLDESEPNHTFLKKADGFWFIEHLSESPKRCRVWLTASITASRLLPSIIVDYAAQKALPRAVNWMQPHFKSSV